MEILANLEMWIKGIWEFRKDFMDHFRGEWPVVPCNPFSLSGTLWERSEWVHPADPTSWEPVHVQPKEDRQSRRVIARFDEGTVTNNEGQGCWFTWSWRQLGSAIEIYTNGTPAVYWGWGPGVMGNPPDSFKVDSYDGCNGIIPVSQIRFRRVDKVT